MSRSRLVRFDVAVGCAGCGATWDVEVVAMVTARDAACEDVTVEEEERRVSGTLRHRREVDCKCDDAPRDARGLMKARNFVDGAEEVYFDAAAAALRRALARAAA